jgi:hypothetical protein
MYQHLTQRHPRRAGCAQVGVVRDELPGEGHLGPPRLVPAIVNFLTENRLPMLPTGKVDRESLARVLTAN